MPSAPDVTLPSRDQLLAIIRVQTEIARHGLDLAPVMAVVVERALDLVKADGAVIELAEVSRRLGDRSGSVRAAPEACQQPFRLVRAQWRYPALQRH